MHIGKKLRNFFLLGVPVVLPIAATILIIIWIFTSIDNILQPLISSAWGFTIPRLGFIILVPIVLLVGLIVSRFGASYGESLISKIPLFGTIYSSIKQISDSFLKPCQDSSKHVVIVEFPMKGTRTIGFVTNESTRESGEELLYVFIPTAPNPTSGFLQIVKREDAQIIDLPVSEAMKVVLSGGKVVPEQMDKEL
jgi:uncharacterized membrane protein